MAGPIKLPAASAVLAALYAVGLAGTGEGARAGEHSDLWGAKGEKWSPTSRLPDFSHAGYHEGERPLPTVRPRLSVKAFGAKGDGKRDDTQAFIDAIAKAKSGAIYVPPGRYKITNIIEIRKSNVVLQGAGPEKTTLYFPKYLNDIKPNWGATTSGRRTSNYSWSGGFIRVQGSYGSRRLATVAASAKRGDTILTLSSGGGIRPGQRIEIRQRDTKDNSLARHLYSGDPADMGKLNGRTKASLVFRVIAARGKQIRFDRPLRFDVRPEWKPEVCRFEPTVTEVGVEGMTFEFPVVKYGGHFTELGYNPVTFAGVADCWLRNVRILNADSGIFAACRFCTFEGVVYDSKRPAARGGVVGHHGIYLSNDDNLFTGFRFNVKFIHDISVSHCAGNVASSGSGVDLCFDHHKRAPYENLFTDIDIGAGSRMYRCGGGRSLGRHCAARGTFWNIRAKRPQSHPGGFGPPSMNLVGVATKQRSVKDAKGKWFEAIVPTMLAPQNIHKAQLERRVGRRR